MAAGQLPSPDEARASLDLATASQRAAVDAARRPVRLHGVFAIATGAAVGVATIGGWAAIGAGFAGLLVVCAVFIVVDRRFKRRRGRILDERALGAHTLKFVPVYTIVFAAAMIRPGDDWQPWYSIGVGLVVAVAGFVWLRLDDRYQTRRLTAGDYDRYDLM